MAFKYAVIIALVAVAQSAVVPVAQVDNENTSFGYQVSDPNTGDYKSHVETRIGGSVAGQYTLLDSDGTKRTVDYTADDINGFNAVVSKDSTVVSVNGAPVVANPPVLASTQVIAGSPIAPAQVIAGSPIAPAQVIAGSPLAPAQVIAGSPLAPAQVIAHPVVPGQVIANPPVGSLPTVIDARSYQVPAVYSNVPTSYSSVYSAPYGYAPVAYSAQW